MTDSTDLIRASRDPELAMEEAHTQGYREARDIAAVEIERLRGELLAAHKEVDRLRELERSLRDELRSQSRAAGDAINHL